MASRVTVFAGPPLCGKTELLLDRYRAELKSNVAGAVLWLCPTWRAAAAVRDRLLNAELPGCFSPGIMTFATFAKAVLEASPDPIRPLTQSMKRQLLRRLLDEQEARGQLKYFRPIAQTSGLLDLIGEFIGELKRLEIWPEHFRQACESRGGVSPKDEELLEIYESYQLLLRQHQLFDAEGSFWSARNWLNQGQRRPFEKLQFVVIDGFSDFTRTQHEILEILAGRANETWITLTLEPKPCRSDLFFKPLKTLTELKKRHAELEVQQLERGAGREESSLRAADSGQSSVEITSRQKEVDAPHTHHAPRPTPLPWPAMDHLERHLFGDPRQETIAGTTAGIEILAGAKPSGELEMIASRIKRLIVEEGVKPGEIAVVFRSPPDSSSLAAEIFDRFGLPVAWEQGIELRRVPMLRALVALLKLDKDDWPFHSLLAVLGSNYFQPEWIEWGDGNEVVGLERTIRRLQIPQGRESLLKALSLSFSRSVTRTQLSGDPALEESPLDSESNLPNPKMLERLAAAFDALPQKATLPDWAKAWEEIARQSGMLNAIDAFRKDEAFMPEGEASADPLKSQRLPASQSARIEPCLPEQSPLLVNRKSAKSGDWSLFRREDTICGDTIAQKHVRVPFAPGCSPPLHDKDFAGWNFLMSILSSGDKLADWLKQHPPELNREEAFRALLDILGSERLSTGDDDAGRVRVLSASSARSLHIPYLFLAGLSEKAFPQPDREDRLYGENEYLRLIEHGLPLSARSDRTREEMLLFYETITRATKRLYLSYPALDDSAQPLSSSPFLQEVEQACGKGECEKGDGGCEHDACKREKCAKWKIPTIKDNEFRPVKKTEMPLSPAEFRVVAMDDALEGKYQRLAALRQWSVVGGKWTVESGGTRGEGRGARELTSSNQHSLLATDHCPLSTAYSPHSPLPSPLFAQNLFAGLELTMLRQNRDRFGPAEGVLSSSMVRQWLHAEYPASRTFSVTELEAYAQCPFRYLLERLLKIRPIEDIALETDYMERGQTVHEVLAEFHQSVNATLGGPSSPDKLDPAAIDRLMQSAMEKGLPKHSNNPVREALREIDRRLIVKWLADYRRQYEDYHSLWATYDKPLAPELFEISFGPSKHPSKTRHVESPFEITIGDETIRLGGRIDRVDTGNLGGREIFNILDYKTGSSARFTLEEFEHGAALQLPLYAIAVMELFFGDRDAIPWRAGYWYVAKDGFKESKSLKMYHTGENGLEELEEEWEMIRGRLGDIIAGLVHGLRGGFFPVFNRDENCTSTCPFSTLCRINQIRSLEKTCLPTIMGEGTKH